MPLSVKLALNSKIRRINLQHGEQINYNRLLELTRQLFQSELNGDDQIEFQYMDDEQDIVTLSSEIELQAALLAMKSIIVTGKPFKLTVKNPKKTEELPKSNLAVHRCITCDECGMSPIIGDRYKCTVRNDYDLCNGCEKKQMQPYPMTRITEPIRWHGRTSHENGDKPPGFGFFRHPQCGRWNEMRGGGHPWRRKHWMCPSDVPVVAKQSATESSNTTQSKSQPDEEVDAKILESVIEESLKHAMKFANQMFSTAFNEYNGAPESKEEHEEVNQTSNNNVKVDASPNQSTSSPVKFIVVDVDEEDKPSSVTATATIQLEKKAEESPKQQVQTGVKDVPTKKWTEEIQLLEDMGFVLDDVDILPLLQKFLGNYEKLQQNLKYNDSDESKDRLKKAKDVGIQRLIAALLADL